MTKPPYGIERLATNNQDAGQSACVAPPRFRFHLLGLAYVPTRPEYSLCPFTSNILNLARMLKDLGHHVTFYGGEGSEVACDEFVETITAADRRACYGERDWRSEFFVYDGNDIAHQTFNRNTIPAIAARQQPGDFLLCPFGAYQKPIADALQNIWAVEPGIGYSGIFAPFRVFPSYAWMHFVYGMTGQHDGGWYDAVIPHYFDPDDFPYKEDKEDYALYVGRLVKRKGVDIAVQVTRELGIPLVIAGQGSLQNESEGLDIRDAHVEFMGAVGPEQRAELMGKARMAFAPTYYIEPFGCVAVEAQLCGTPVLTTDWGAFSETVLHGVTGFRCRSFDDFVWAADNIEQLRPADCREWAIRNYAMDRIQWMYQEYFTKIADLERAGWYEHHVGRKELDWLRKHYPASSTSTRRQHHGSLAINKRHDRLRRLWRVVKGSSTLGYRQRVNGNGSTDVSQPPFTQMSRARDVTPQAHTIRWEGSQFVHRSLALVNRELCLQLIDAGFELSIMPHEPNQFEFDVDPRFQKLADRVNGSISGPAAVHVRHQWPPNFTPPPEGHWVMIQPWEFGSLPKDWIEVMSCQVDELWVPTSYVRDCYIRSGVPADQVHVVPNGVDINRLHPDVPPFDLPGVDGQFKFLFVGGTIWRKGIDLLLRAYLTAFSSSDDVCLVIKDFGKHTFYQGATWDQAIHQIQAQPETPAILYLDQDLPSAQVPSLYTACDCLVHPYRGEGFGLPIAEAMASSLPVIVTNYGAALDFCSGETAYLIPAKEERPPEKRLGYLETVDYPCYAEPSVESLARLMRYVYEHPENARVRGARAATHIRANFTWEHAAQEAMTRLRALQEQPIRRYKEMAVLAGG